MVNTNKFYYDIEEIINHWKQFNPIRCHRLGIHDFDGLLPDYSFDNIQNRIMEIKQDILHLITLRRDYPDPYTSFEFNLVKFTLERELYELSELQEYKFNPDFYIRQLHVLNQSFTVTDFGPIDERIKIVIRFLINFPLFFTYPKENLEKSLIDIFVEHSIQSLTGFINFLQFDLIDFVQQTNNKSLIKESNEAIKKAILSLNMFKTDLIENHRPYVHTRYALGKDQFLLMLKKTENVNIDADELLQIGETVLEENYSSLQSILQKHEPDYFEKIQNEIPTTDQLFDQANISIQRILTFLNEKQIFEIPSEEKCIVAETPESVARYSIAGLNPPGPFETSKNAEVYFYITLPDSSWNQTQTHNYLKLFNKASFDLIIINEIYPGQYLKILYEKYRTLSIISNLFARSTSMIDGYSMYVQELMIKEGYNPFIADPDKIKVGSLLITLLRDVRLVVSTKIHCYDMTLDEAKKLFMEKAFLSEELAQTEAKRAIMSPMYLTYTLGKLLINKLQADYKLEKGDEFTLKQFHEEFLGLGSAPITLLRSIMLKTKSNISKIF